ncbi:hypothetical protein LK09_19865 [Microbacterium mangrovi]|uniref:Uncharacterized protein n=1 Tax=Microbacterium mangrovi TaxID=1348253 RepID=A0A0B2A0V2_9MICO|nr:Imm61 family immunity protein [Microbacterium mangrovi]KHK95166.1 hypothetical protein LK09_19865 [Microbacterium mangrovi]
MNTIELNPDFSAWAAGAGYAIFHAPGSVTIANDGGEIRFTITAADRTIALERAERAEEPRLLMTSPEMNAIERMLIDYVGDDLRSTRNLGHVFFPFDWRECAPGYAVIDFGDRWTGLSRLGRPMDLRIRDRDYLHPAVMYSYIADADPVALMQSYSDPVGAPLLRNFVSPPRR